MHLPRACMMPLIACKMWVSGLRTPATFNGRASETIDRALLVSHWLGFAGEMTAWISHQPAQQAECGSGMKQTQGRSNKVRTLKQPIHPLHECHKAEKALDDPSDSALTWLGFIFRKMSPLFALSSPCT